MNGTLNYYLEVLVGSIVVRDRERGEVQCFRPDIKSAQEAAEKLEATGMFITQDERAKGGSKQP